MKIDDRKFVENIEKYREIMMDLWDNVLYEQDKTFSRLESALVEYRNRQLLVISFVLAVAAGVVGNFLVSSLFGQLVHANFTMIFFSTFILLLICGALFAYLLPLDFEFKANINPFEDYYRLHGKVLCDSEVDVDTGREMVVKFLVHLKCILIENIRTDSIPLKFLKIREIISPYREKLYSLDTPYIRLSVGFDVILGLRARPYSLLPHAYKTISKEAKMIVRSLHYSNYYFAIHDLFESKSRGELLCLRSTRLSKEEEESILCDYRRAMETTTYRDACEILNDSITAISD